MTSSYPLEQLALIKQKKLEEAEKALREKKELLEQEEKKLREVEKERDKVKQHRADKLEQLREHLDKGDPTLKVEQARAYLKIVDEKLKVKEHKVYEQKKLTIAAEKEVEKARADLIKKQHDVEKMKLHRKEWEQEKRKEEVRKEGAESDETGAIAHHRKTKRSSK